MSMDDKPDLYLTPAHPCNYLPQREASQLVADPTFPKTPRLYSSLLAHGFRRTGKEIYMPHCDSCNSCIAVRVPVEQFVPSRAQQRTRNKNRDIRIRPLSPEYRQQHFLLYQQYLQSRHPGGGMDNPTPQDYMNFLTCQWADTLFFEMRLHDTLAGVAVADVLDNGLSAVYSFFDPQLHKRSLGRFAILSLIEQAKSLNLPWLYLGYWVADCQKMNYKNEYQPLEYYIDNTWTQHE
ncbi:MAG: arginyltransferase [Gammaproteobacteria bacterium]